MSRPHNIAIVGVGGVFPGVGAHLEKFWQLIKSAETVAKPAPSQRWRARPEDLRRAPEEPLGVDHVASDRACFLDFEDDPVLRQALHREGWSESWLEPLDPVFRLALWAAARALEDCGLESIQGERCSVIFGNIILPSDHSSAMVEQCFGPELARRLGLNWPSDRQSHAYDRFVASLPAALVARLFQLGGGSATLDAACATSLYALKLAVDELESGRVDAVLTGGISRPSCLYTQMGFSQLGAVSKRGLCSPFDEQGDGLVVGEGAGLFVLKRLEDAVAQGHHIYGVIRAIGLSNDLDGSLLAPSSEGQLRALNAAYEQAGWKPSDVDLIECHATGTILGDRTEFQSLQQLWEQHGAQRAGQRCVIGSVKSNIGHLLTGAAAAGLCKVLWALRTKTLPPTANFTKAHPKLGMEDSSFEVLTEPRAWDLDEGQSCRRAAINAFGFGGINAHVLIEDYQPSVSVGAAPSLPDLDVAVVGMGAHFGPWVGREAFSERVFGTTAHPKDKLSELWPDCAVSFELEGYAVKDLDIELGQFRIPPVELKDSLPQQLLMLSVADEAFRDAKIDRGQNFKAGTFIGLGLDANTSQFHFRWALRDAVEKWNDEQGWSLDPEALQRWLYELREATFPALTANRTMGALGGIVASRVARELRIGGPSFTVSAEENSGLKAVAWASSLLRQGLLDVALVGAVDMTADPRILRAERELVGGDFEFGEGAGAVVLMTTKRARREGRPIYARLRGLGQASAGLKPDLNGQDSQRLRSALQRAWTESQRGLESPGYTELGQVPGQPLSSLNAEFLPTDVGCDLVARLGHCGAAQHFASFMRACVALKEGRLPLSSEPTRSWLRDRGQETRSAGVLAVSRDGNVMALSLEEAEKIAEPDLNLQQGAGLRHAALFACGAQDRSGLAVALRQLKSLARGQVHSLDELAREWHQQPASHIDGQALRLAFVLSESASLESVLTRLIAACESGQRLDRLPGLDAYYGEGPALAGEWAYVYPGSGNHYQGMGRELAQVFPTVFERQDFENESLASQLCLKTTWADDPTVTENCQEQLILGQVSFGTVLTDLAREFLPEPQAAIGYSLGESASFFGLRVWQARDEMLARIRQSSLFKTDMAGPCDSVRETWQLSEGEAVDWSVAVVQASEEDLSLKLRDWPRLYLLIVNTDQECVLGGDSVQLSDFVKAHGFHHWPLEGITAVHCEVAKPVSEPYKALHTLPICRRDVRFYSGARAESYELSSERAAESILAQALEGVRFPATIRKAYEDGVRVFVEIGPNASSTRMIREALKGHEHLAVALNDPKNSGEYASFLKGLAELVAAGQPVVLDKLYPVRQAASSKRKVLTLPCKATSWKPVSLPARVEALVKIEAPTEVNAESKGVEELQLSVQNRAVYAGAAAAIDQHLGQSVHEAVRSEMARGRAHDAYMSASQGMMQQMFGQLSIQMQLMAAGGVTVPETASPSGPVFVESAPSVRLNREQCMEFAIGSIAKVLGPEFAAIDQYPTRVRLPDEPLMLVDRILTIDGEARSMTHGRVVTEHDVKAGAWYLDEGRIPTCVAVEAGQADLFLSGYLGIDFITKGLAVYRLLDAVVTFHRPLPEVGEVIHYDIHIDRFFKQGETYLFRFRFEGTVNGEPLLSMKEGCAGFFSQQELDAGKGIIHTQFDLRELPGKRPEDWRELVSMKVESYSDAQVAALREGRYAEVFGPEFGALPLRQPMRLPGLKPGTELMKLLDRVLLIDPKAGRFGMGMIRAEMDIRPDDWFLTCHFVDDMVMPGTLMYECCMHTLRLFLMRMGWIGEEGQFVWEPVPGVSSRLKCRGQVTASTQKVQYQVVVKELGYGPEPFCIADALMFADGKPIVEITDMSIRLSGVTREQLTELWSGVSGQAVKTVLYGPETIRAFAIGKPSEAFGEPYKVFDEQRVIARLPGPPYQFLDRIVKIERGVPFVLKAGEDIVGEYDVPPDEWYFAANGSSGMPFSVLLEIALQPCGWLAAYLGSALVSESDLSFRNLGGQAVQHKIPGPDTGTLEIQVKMTRVSNSGGMIIQNYDMAVRDSEGLVYKGDTYFGFFSKEALANQIGLREAEPFEPSAEGLSRSQSVAMPTGRPFADDMLTMIDRVTVHLPSGGPQGLGFIRGEKDVDPDEWFFKAHFYQDPVCPGSLGLESFLQLLKVFAWERWGQSLAAESARFETMVLGQKHRWIYRGQVVPKDDLVTVQACVTAIDEEQRQLTADGFLIVDGRIIYEMRDFSLKLHGE